jgi:predicted transcriptional regulator
MCFKHVNYITIFYNQLSVMATNIQSDIRRDKLDIILHILNIGNTPVKKTHILYKAGINFYQLSRYLDLLLKTEMIEQIKEPYVAYRTTEKGRVLINMFSALETESGTAPPATIASNAGLKNSPSKTV